LPTRDSTVATMADGLDVEAMLERFRERAAAVRKRPLPPVAGDERRAFIEQANTDFRDFAIIGDATASLDDGFLVLKVDLRPADQRN
jgi:hypothetical protein